MAGNFAGELFIRLVPDAGPEFRKNAETELETQGAKLNLPVGVELKTGWNADFQTDFKKKVAKAKKPVVPAKLTIQKGSITKAVAEANAHIKALKRPPKLSVGLSVTQTAARAAVAEANRRLAASKRAAPILRVRLDLDEDEIKLMREVRAAVNTANVTVKGDPIEIPLDLDEKTIAAVQKKAAIASAVAQARVDNAFKNIDARASLIGREAFARAEGRLLAQVEQGLDQRSLLNARGANQRELIELRHQARMAEIVARGQRRRRATISESIARISSASRVLRNDLSGVEFSTTRLLRRLGFAFTLFTGGVTASFAAIGAAATVQFGRVEEAANRAAAIFTSESANAPGVNIATDMNMLLEENARVTAELLEVSRDVALKTNFDTQQIAEGFRFLAGAGVEYKQALEGILPVAEFAQAGNIELEEATELLVQGFVSAGLPIQSFGEELVGITDKLAFLAQNAPITMTEGLQAFANGAAAVTKAYGQNINEAINLVGIFGRAGFKGLAAGTQVSILIREISKSASIRAPEAFEKYGVALENADGTTRSFASQLDDLARVFYEMTDGFNDPRAFAQLKKEFGLTEKASRAFQQILPQIIALQEAGSSASRELSRVVEDSVGRLDLQSEKIRQTLAFQFGQFLDGIKILAEEFAGPFAASLTDFFKQINGEAENSVDLMDSLRDRARALGESVVDALGSALDDLRGAEGARFFNGIIEGYRSVLSGLANAFVEFRAIVFGPESDLGFLAVLGDSFAAVGRFANRALPDIARAIGEITVAIRDNVDELKFFLRVWLGVFIGAKFNRWFITPLTGIFNNLDRVRKALVAIGSVATANGLATTTSQLAQMNRTTSGLVTTTDALAASQVTLGASGAAAGSGTTLGAGFGIAGKFALDNFGGFGGKAIESITKEQRVAISQQREWGREAVGVLDIYRATEDHMALMNDTVKAVKGGGAVGGLINADELASLAAQLDFLENGLPVNELERIARASASGVFLPDALVDPALSMRMTQMVEDAARLGRATEINRTTLAALTKQIDELQRLAFLYQAGLRGADVAAEDFLTLVSEIENRPDIKGALARGVPFDPVFGGEDDPFLERMARSIRRGTSDINYAMNDLMVFLTMQEDELRRRIATNTEMRARLLTSFNEAVSATRVSDLFKTGATGGRGALGLTMGANEMERLGILASQLGAMDRLDFSAFTQANAEMSTVLSELEVLQRAYDGLGREMEQAFGDLFKIDELLEELISGDILRAQREAVELGEKWNVNLRESTNLYEDLLKLQKRINRESEVFSNVAEAMAAQEDKLQQLVRYPGSMRSVAFTEAEGFGIMSDRAAMELEAYRMGLVLQTQEQALLDRVAKVKLGPILGDMEKLGNLANNLGDITSNTPLLGGKLGPGFQGGRLGARLLAYGDEWAYLTKQIRAFQFERVGLIQDLRLTEQALEALTNPLADTTHHMALLEDVTRLFASRGIELPGTIDAIVDSLGRIQQPIRQAIGAVEIDLERHISELREVEAIADRARAAAVNVSMTMTEQFPTGTLPGTGAITGGGPMQPPPPPESFVAQARAAAQSTQEAARATQAIAPAAAAGADQLGAVSSHMGTVTDELIRSGEFLQDVEAAADPGKSGSKLSTAFRWIIGDPEDIRRVAKIIGDQLKIIGPKLLRVGGIALKLAGWIGVAITAVELAIHWFRGFRDELSKGIEGNEGASEGFRKLGDMLGWLWDKTKWVLGKVWDAIEWFFDAINWIAEHEGRRFAKLLIILAEGFNWVAEKVEAAWPYVQSFFSEVKRLAGVAVQPILDFVETVDGIVDSFQILFNSEIPLADRLRIFTAHLTSVVVNGFRQMVSSINTIIWEFFVHIPYMIGQAVAPVTNAITGFFNSVYSAASDAVNEIWMKFWMSPLGKGLAEIIKRGARLYRDIKFQILAFFNSLNGNVFDAIESLLTRLGHIKRQIKDAIVEGISDLAGWLIKTFEDIEWTKLGKEAGKKFKDGFKETSKDTARWAFWNLTGIGLSIRAIQKVQEALSGHDKALRTSSKTQAEVLQKYALNWNTLGFVLSDEYRTQRELMGDNLESLKAWALAGVDLAGSYGEAFGLTAENVASAFEAMGEMMDRAAARNAGNAVAQAQIISSLGVLQDRAARGEVELTGQLFDDVQFAAAQAGAEARLNFFNELNNNDVPEFDYFISRTASPAEQQQKALRDAIENTNTALADSELDLALDELDGLFIDTGESAGAAAGGLSDAASAATDAAGAVTELTAPQRRAAVNVLGKVLGDLSGSYQLTAAEADALEAALPALDDALEKQRQAVQALDDQLQSLRNTQLEGTKAFSDQAADLQEEIDKLELKKLDLLIAGRDPENFRVTRIDDEIEALNQQLQRVNLQERVELGPLRRQLNELFEPEVAELPFEEIKRRFEELTTAREAAGTVLDENEALRSRIDQLIQQSSQQFQQFGSDVTQGFTDGVMSGNDDLYKAAIENANTYVVALNEVFRFGSPSRTTTERGQWIGQGLVNGIESTRGAVYDVTSTTMAGVVKILRDGERATREAGGAIMRGFFLGMRSFWVDTIRPFILDIAVWIRENKGPIAYDRTLLQPAGEAMMQGFHRGLQDGFGEIKAWVGTVGPSLANDGFPKDIFVKRSANFLIGNARSDLDFDPESTFGDLLPNRIAAYAGALDPSLAFLHRTMSLADTKDMAAHLARLYDLQVSSLYRPFDRDSRHSIGTAADLSNGYSPTKEMDALARDVAPLFGKVFNQIIWRNKDVNRGWNIPGHMDHVHLDWLKDPNFKLGSGRKGTGIGLDFPGSSELVDRALYQASLDTGVPVQLLGAIAAAESGFRTTAGSPAGAQGLMQLMPATARSLGVSNIFDPFQNARGGATYIARQLEAFNGNLRLALAAYNAGPGAARVALSSYPETINYVRTVLDYLRRFGGWDGSIGGFRAMGGNVNAGTPYVVGERGRELFIPDQNGSIISNKNVRDLIVALHEAQDMGGGKVIYDQRQVHVQSNSPDSMAVAAQVDARMRSQIVGVHR